MKALSCPNHELVADPEDDSDVLVQDEEEDLPRISDYDYTGPADNTAVAKGETGEV